MSERENILGRVREALRGSGARPAHQSASRPSGAADHADGSHLTSKVSTREMRRWLPAVGPSAAEQFSLFEANAKDLRAEWRLVADSTAAGTLGAELRAQGNWKRVAAHSGALAKEFCAAVGLPVVWTDTGYDVRQLEQCDAGITECDALVAQTGSVLLTSRSAGGRALSVLPPHHVVLARREQMVPDLPAAFELLKARYETNYPSFLTFITGPSRTGDIERILVLGAHGPKQLTIVCW